MNRRLSAALATMSCTAAALVLAACTHGPAGGRYATGRDTPRVTVEFIDPDRYVDARWRGGRGADDSVLDLLRDHLAEQARGCLPPGSLLAVRITDIDLAGETPPALASADFRVMRDITWPRIDLGWRLTGADGAPLGDGSESVSDMNYLRHAARTDGAPLRYDRALLTGWLRRRFCP